MWSYIRNLQQYAREVFMYHPCGIAMSHSWPKLATRALSSKIQQTRRRLFSHVKQAENTKKNSLKLRYLSCLRGLRIYCPYIKNNDKILGKKIRD